MTWRELSPSDLNRLKAPLIIDVRSPCEHAAEYIPASINVPLLSDDERVIVGTIYKQEGEVVARRRALNFISPRIPEIVDRILALKKPGQAVVIHCWRGGLRSEAVCSFLSVVGIDSFRLTGGYKAWRGSVLKDFAENGYDFEPVVLCGLTGAGKTDVLGELARLGLAVLDLEALAIHRGSVFGGMGLADQPTQKNFEAALWLALRAFGKEQVFMEAESRKVGRLSLPDLIFDRIQSGRKILVTGTIEARVERIVDDYARSMRDQDGNARAVSILHSLKERLGGTRVAEIEAIAGEGDLKAAVKILLVEYYDPLYMRHVERNSPFELEVSGDDAAQAARTISQWAKSLQSSAQSITG